VNNFSVIRALEIVALHEKPASCGECPEENSGPATHRCNDCHIYLCSFHRTAHQSSRKTLQHTLFTLDDIKKGDAKISTGPRMMCKIHEGEELKLYCETCNTIICRDCTLLDHRSPLHEYGFIKQIASKHKGVISSILSEADEAVGKVGQYMVQVKDLQKRIQTNGVTIEKQINRSFDLIYVELENRRVSLLSSLKAVTGSKEKLINMQMDELMATLGNLQSACEYTRKVIESGTDAEIVLATRQIRSRLSDLSETKTPSGNYIGSVEFSIELSQIRERISLAGNIRDTKTQEVSSMEPVQEEIKVQPRDPILEREASTPGGPVEDYKPVTPLDRCVSHCGIPSEPMKRSRSPESSGRASPQLRATLQPPKGYNSRLSRYQTLIKPIQSVNSSSVQPPAVSSGIGAKSATRRIRRQRRQKSLPVSYAMALTNVVQASK
jgi:hypothetical protein